MKYFSRKGARSKGYFEAGTFRNRVRRAFSLVELLVVFAIIGILVALLMPALSRAKYETKMLQCMAGQRTIIAGMASYAFDNQGYLPREDGSFNAGDNPSVISPKFWSLMTHAYSIPQRAMFCPFERDDEIAAYAMWIPADGFDTIGYGIWVPRSDNSSGGLFPPGVNYHGSITDLDASGSCAGPTKTNDPVGLTVPVICDSATTVYYIPPSLQFTDSLIPLSDLNYIYYHIDNSGRAGAINEGYVDGHVERVPANGLRLRYTQGPFINWR